MADDGVTKFVGVFVTRADDPHNALPDHIADLEFLPMEDVRKEVSERPGDFTETLRGVLAFVEEVDGAAAAGRG
jgi:hypothetical protein